MWPKGGVWQCWRTKIRVGVAKERGVAMLEGVALWKNSLGSVAFKRERERESLEGVAFWRGTV